MVAKIPPPTFKLSGDSALVAIFGNDIDPELNRNIHTLDHVLSGNPLKGVIETLPTYSTLMVHYDPLLLDENQVKQWILSAIEINTTSDQVVSRHIEIPTIYGGEYGPDLDFVANYHNLSTTEVIRIHSSVEYPVYMMGFTPGFPYLGGMDPAIATPRLDNPRTHVPAGSVGIAGKQTGIYSIDSPGGWQLIGYTPIKLFEPSRQNPTLLSPGDRIRFIPVTKEESSQWLSK